MKTKEVKIIDNPNFSFLILFLFLFVYYLLFFNSALFYHHHQPLFLFDKTYLKEFLLYPGGPVDLITRFFFQFFYFNLFGSLFQATLSVSIFIIIYKFVKEIRDFKYSLVLSFLPVAFLLILQNHYNFPLMLSVKYLFALIFYLGYVKIPERYKVFFIPLSFLIYYILGGWIYLFYVALCILHELLFSQNRKKHIYTLLNALVYFIYPYIAARYLFAITPKEAYFYIMPNRFTSWPFVFNLNLYFYLFFISLPVLLIVLFFYPKNIKVRVKKGKKGKKGKKQKKLKAGAKRTLPQPIFIILMGILVLAFSFDIREKRKIQVDYFAQQGRWDDLLDVSRGIKGYSALVNFNVNRALYHTGRLLEHLFYYPQMVGEDGLFIENFSRVNSILTIDLYLDLGHIKAAQVMAYEGQTKFGYTPRILKSIILTNIINEEYNIARKFLDILNKSIMHKKWVKHYRSYLCDKSLIESDSMIQSRRKLTPKSDFFVAIDRGLDKDLIELLKEDENNKMAFEYLMAYYLLDRRFDDLLENLGKFKKLGYKKYPRIIEEALLLINTVTPIESDKIDYRIDEQTIERFKQFHSIRSGFKNKADAKEVLTKDFFNTYWYYLAYVRRGKIRVG